MSGLFVSDNGQAYTEDTTWLLDVGPFFDRFGAQKMAVLTSTDAGVIAIVKDCQVRKWINVKLPEVTSSLLYIGTKVPGVDSVMQAAIVNTPAASEENFAMRRLYFSFR